MASLGVRSESGWASPDRATSYMDCRPVHTFTAPRIGQKPLKMSNNWAHLPLHSTEPWRKAAQGKGSALLHQGQKRDVLAVKKKFKKQDNYFFFFKGKYRRSENPVGCVTHCWWHFRARVKPGESTNGRRTQPLQGSPTKHITEVETEPRHEILTEFPAYQASSISPLKQIRKSYHINLKSVRAFSPLRHNQVCHSVWDTSTTRISTGHPPCQNHCGLLCPRIFMQTRRHGRISQQEDKFIL